MQQMRRLKSGLPDRHAKEKEMRVLHPTELKHEGRQVYSNKLGQEFFARAKPDVEKGHYSIEVFQLGEGEPIARFLASAQLMGKAFMITFMTRRGWESLPGHRGRFPTGYGAARLILKEAIALARELGAKTIYLEDVPFKLFAYYPSLGFKEVPNSKYMQLAVPEK